VGFVTGKRNRRHRPITTLNTDSISSVYYLLYPHTPAPTTHPIVLTAVMPTRRRRRIREWHHLLPQTLIRTAWTAPASQSTSPFSLRPPLMEGPILGLLAPRPLAPQLPAFFGQTHKLEERPTLCNTSTSNATTLCLPQPLGRPGSILRRGKREDRGRVLKQRCENQSALANIDQRCIH
jgi:hypothetical protein